MTTIREQFAKLKLQIRPKRKFFKTTDSNDSYRIYFLRRKHCRHANIPPRPQAGRPEVFPALFDQKGSS
jgi:hypothetical protein